MRRLELGDVGGYQKPGPGRQWATTVSAVAGIVAEQVIGRSQGAV